MRLEAALSLSFALVRFARLRRLAFAPTQADDFRKRRGAAVTIAKLGHQLVRSCKCTVTR